MKLSRYIFCIFIGCITLYGQGYYPVFAFHCKNISWFRCAGPDSLGLNTVLFSDLSYSKETILEMLDSANSAGLKAIVGHARKGSQDRDDLQWCCQLHKRVFLAKDSSSFMEDFWNGDVVLDTFAAHDTAFVAFRDSLDPCNMLKSIKDITRFYETSRPMDVVFHLKIDSFSLDTLGSGVRVCSLYITKNDNVVAFKNLTVSDFTQINYYQPFSFNCYVSA